MDPEIEISDEENTEEESNASAAAEESSEVTDNAEEINPIVDIISAIGKEEYNSANDVFNNEISSRLNAAIEQSRIDVASKMYNNAKEEEVVDAEV